MKLFVLGCMLLALCGCIEDKGAILAKCELEAKKDKTDFGDTSRITLCMRAVGYRYIPTSDDCMKNISNNVTIEILVSSPQCYEKVRWLDIITSD